MPHHRHFGFTASSHRPCDEDREGAAGALPAADWTRPTPASWPRYVLDPGEANLRREPAESSRQLSAVEDALAAARDARRRAARRDTFLIIGVLLATFTIILLAQAIAL